MPKYILGIVLQAYFCSISALGVTLVPLQKTSMGGAEECKTILVGDIHIPAPLRNERESAKAIFSYWRKNPAVRIGVEGVEFSTSPTALLDWKLQYECAVQLNSWLEEASATGIFSSSTEKYLRIWVTHYLQYRIKAGVFPLKSEMQDHFLVAIHEMAVAENISLEVLDLPRTCLIAHLDFIRQIWPLLRDENFIEFLIEKYQLNLLQQEKQIVSVASFWQQAIESVLPPLATILQQTGLYVQQALNDMQRMKILQESPLYINIGAPLQHLRSLIDNQDIAALAMSTEESIENIIQSLGDLYLLHFIVTNPNTLVIAGVGHLIEIMPFLQEKGFDKHRRAYAATDSLSLVKMRYGEENLEFWCKEHLHIDTFIARIIIHALLRQGILQQGAAFLLEKMLGSKEGYQVVQKQIASLKQQLEQCGKNESALEVALAWKKIERIFFQYGTEILPHFHICPPNIQTFLQDPSLYHEHQEELLKRYLTQVIDAHQEEIMAILRPLIEEIHKLVIIDEFASQMQETISV